MSFKEQLIRFRQKTESAYINFLVNYKKKETSFHLFYEGAEDYSFYTNYVNSIIKSANYTYTCNGKNKLHKIYAMLDWSAYNKNRILFFTDKDYSDIIPETYSTDENIFVTTFYSIENYLVTEDQLTRVIKEGLHVDEPAIIEQIQSCFLKALTNFVQTQVVIAAWIILKRRSGELVLNDIRIEDLFTIDVDLQFNLNRQLKRFQYLLTKTKQPYEKCFLEVKKIVKEISARPYKSFIRGKFEIAFFVQFINQLPNYLNKGRVKGEKTAAFRFTINCSNAVEYLGPRLPIPLEVDIFLRRNLSKV